MCASPETRLTARARVQHLVDPGSLIEHHPGTCPAIIGGSALIAGRPAIVIAYDPSARKAYGPLMIRKIIALQERAMRTGSPTVYLFDGAPQGTINGRTIFAETDGIGRVFYNHAKMSGHHPQVCAVFGSQLSVKSFPIALCDASVFIEGKCVSLSSPDVVKQMIGQEVTQEELGSAHVHATITGMADAVVDTDVEAIEWIKQYLEYMPHHTTGLPERADPVEPDTDGKSITDVLPTSLYEGYDVAEVIRLLVDGGSYFPLQSEYATELVTAFARIDGVPVGIIANNSKVGGGVLDIESCDKAVGFIRLCDAYRLPLLYLMDVPGFMVGRRAEHAGIIRAGAAMFSASACASVPKISVVLRKAHTAGLYAMCGPAFAPDACLALRGSQVSIVGEKFVEAEIQNDLKLQALEGEERENTEKKIRMSYLTHTDPRRVAVELIFDAIIEPSQLRNELAQRFLRLTSDRTSSARPPASPLRP